MTKIKLTLASIMLMATVVVASAFNLTNTYSWNIPEGEVAQVKIGDTVIWPPVPYITDGLVSWWDGKWNNGIGLHSDSTTVWKDLVGGRDATLFDTYTWSNDTWNVNAFNSRGYAQWNGSDLPESQTWQFLIYPTNGDVGSRIIGESPTIISPRLMGNNSNQISIYNSYGISPNTVVPYYYWYQCHQHTITHEKDSSIVKYYLDGRLVVTWSGATNNSTGGQSYGRFANTSKGGNCGTDASYYSVRLYDRVLSDDEIYQSYVKDCERFNLQQRYWTYAKDAWLWADAKDGNILFSDANGTINADLGEVVLRTKSKTLTNTTWVVTKGERVEDGLRPTGIRENTGLATNFIWYSDRALFQSNTPLDNIEFSVILVTKNEQSETFIGNSQARIYLGNFSTPGYLYYSSESLYFKVMSTNANGQRIYLPARGYFGRDPVIFGIRVKSVDGEYNAKVSVNGVVVYDISGTVPEEVINTLTSVYKPGVNYNQAYPVMSSDHCEFIVWDHIPENWDDIEAQLIAKYNAKRADEYDIPGWTKYYFADGSVSNRFITGATTTEFRNNLDLVNIVVGTHAKSIGSQSFLDCKNLTNIVFPENGIFERIYDWSFRWCTNLTSVVIPDTCTKISHAAFFGCYGLTNVVLPDTLIQLGAKDSTTANVGPFQDCNSLQEIRLPDSLTTLGSAAFEHCDNLRTVSNSTNLTYISERAFQNCPTLTEFHFGPNIDTIGTDAFTNCVSLTNVYVDDLSKWCAVNLSNRYANPLYYASNFYVNGEAITELVIPNDVEYIAPRTFVGNRILKSLTVPDNVKNIGNSAFYQNYKLKNVIIGNGVTNIDNSAFYNCSLTNIVFGNNVKYIGSYAFQFNYHITDITFPDSLEITGKYTFDTCPSLSNVTFGLNISTVGSNSFRKCTNLKTFRYYKHDNETNAEAEERIKGLVSGSGFDITGVEFICLNYDYAESAWSWIDITDENTLWTDSTRTIHPQLGEVVNTIDDKKREGKTWYSQMKKAEVGIYPTNMPSDRVPTGGILRQTDAMYAANSYDPSNCEFAVAYVLTNDRYPNKNIGRLQTHPMIFKLIYINNLLAVSLPSPINSSGEASSAFYVFGTGNNGYSKTRILRNLSTNNIMYTARIKTVNGIQNSIISANGTVLTNATNNLLEGTQPLAIVPAVNYYDYGVLPCDYLECLWWKEIPEDWDKIEESLLRKYNIPKLEW